jgi:hypothetical protein
LNFETENPEIEVPEDEKRIPKIPMTLEHPGIVLHEDEKRIPIIPMMMSMIVLRFSVYLVYPQHQSDSGSIPPVPQLNLVVEFPGSNFPGLP